MATKSDIAEVLIELAAQRERLCLLESVLHSRPRSPSDDNITPYPETSAVHSLDGCLSSPSNSLQLGPEPEYERHRSPALAPGEVAGDQRESTLLVLAQSQLTLLTRSINELSLRRGFVRLYSLQLE